MALRSNFEDAFSLIKATLAMLDRNWLTALSALSHTDDESAYLYLVSSPTYSVLIEQQIAALPLPLTARRRFDSPPHPSKC